MNNLFILSVSRYLLICLSLCFLFTAFLFHEKIHAREPANALILTCPADLTIQAALGACAAIPDYNSLVWESTETLIDTLFNPEPGSYFPIGTSPVTLIVTDVQGNVEACAFHVTVTEFVPGPTCYPLVPVDLNEDCEREITWDMMVESPYGCPLNYSVQILGPLGQNIGNVVTEDFIGQEWTVKVTNTFNGNSCWGEIVVNANSLPPSIACPADVLILCHQEPDSTLTGIPIAIGCLEYSELDIGFVDLSINSFCNGDTLAYRIERTWTANDPFGNQTSCVQNIYARRIKLNEIVFPPNFDGNQQPAFSCHDSLSFEMLTDTSNTGIPQVLGLPLSPFTPACDLAVTFSDEIEQICGNHYELKRKWTVFDFCESTSTNFTQIIVVEDVQAPLFTVPETILVSTSQTCGEESDLPSITLLQECSDYEVEILTPWDTLQSNGGTISIPQIPGSFEVTYQATDACGNTTSQVTELVVGANSMGNCPPPVTISCNDYFDNLQEALENGDVSVMASFGYPPIAVNCGFDLDETVSVEVDDCGQGEIVRTISIDEAGVSSSCTQTINIEHVSDFTVQFPPDTTITCGLTPLDAGEPILTGADCENIEVTFTDQVINVVPDACYKIVRTWQVANSCSTDVIFGEQVIKVTDNVDPVFTNCSIPDVCISGDSCDATVVLPMPVIDECSPNVTVTATGQLGSGFGPFHNKAAGTYNVTYTALDNCNNQTVCTTTVKVKDCEPPVALCKSGLAITLFGNPPSVQVWAVDFDDDSYDNCPGNLKFTFSSNVDDIGRTFTCDDLYQQLIQLWVSDGAGNQDFCETILNLQPPIGSDCEPNEAISGEITTENNLGIAQAEVSTSTGETVSTGGDGDYVLTFPFGITDWTITPFKNNNPMNGVTTFDAVLLTKHILGTQPLDSPYKIIAADVNNSGTVTTLDAVEIRKLILGYSSNFPNNTSWRFVPEDYVFPNPAIPFVPVFPENIYTEIPPDSSTSFDFIGIKVGDLNGSAISSFAGEPNNEK